MRLVLQVFKRHCKLGPAAAMSGHHHTWVKQHSCLSGDLTATASPQEASRKEQAPYPCSFAVPSNVTLGEPTGSSWQLEVS